MPSISITIKHGSSEDLFEIDTEWNILFLKQRACQLFSLSAEECDLYLGSVRLDEYSKISVTNICENSVVQVLLRPKKNRSFIYCYQCAEVTSASLEWKCEQCGKPGFIPSDSSRPERRVPGTCSTCESTLGTLSFHCIKEFDHHPTVYMKHINRNLDLVPCIACLSEECDLIVTVCEQKTHALCLSCFKAYAKEYLEQGLFSLVEDIGYTLGCPAGCADSYISDPHHFRLLGSDFYSRYKELSVARYMLTQNTVICPNCGEHWDASDSDTVRSDLREQRAGTRSLRSNWITCTPPAGCGTLFCAACGWQYTSAAPNPIRCHCNMEGTTDSTNRSSSRFLPIWASLKMSADERENRDTIARTCRPCPRCKAATEKAGGCNHMHCSRCRFDWCWICCEEWTGECQSLHWL